MSRDRMIPTLGAKPPFLNSYLDAFLTFHSVSFGGKVTSIRAIMMGMH